MTMPPTTLTLIDLRLPMPDNVTLTRQRSRLGRDYYRLEGLSATHARERLEAAAEARGYFIDRKENGTRMLRQEQTIFIDQISEHCLEISINDPEQLPFAQATESSVTVGPVTIPLEGVRIVPRRERCDDHVAEWVGEWEIEGKGPEQLSTMVLDGLAKLGLRTMGPFVPKDAGLGDVWSSEAYSLHRLVKVMAVPRRYHVKLTLELYDSTLAVPNDEAGTGEQGERI